MPWQPATARRVSDIRRVFTFSSSVTRRRWFPRRRGWPSRARPLALTGSPATLRRLALTLARRLGEEVARYQTSHAVQLAHVEAVVVHVAVYVDLVSGLERQLDLLQ